MFLSPWNELCYCSIRLVRVTDVPYILDGQTSDKMNQDKWGRGLKQVPSNSRRRGWIEKRESPKMDPEALWRLRSLLSSGGSPAEPVWRLFHNLERFHLTLRRTDWDQWETNGPLTINPYRNDKARSDAELMRRDMHAALVDGAQLPYEYDAWGRMFNIMTRLQTLSITFETAEDKEDEMEEIVEWARTWRFEISSWRRWMLEDSNEVMAHMVVDDRPIEKTSWRGLRYQWSDSYPKCPATPAPQFGGECAYCEEKELLLRDGVSGPQILTWTVTWSRKLVDPPVDIRDTETRPGSEGGQSSGNTGLPFEYPLL